MGQQLLDFAPSHTALILREFFAKKSTHVAPQPPYSPDLAPCDFWLFSKLKLIYLQTNFQNASKTGGDVGTSTLVLRGEYFEGNDVDLEE